MANNTTNLFVVVALLALCQLTTSRRLTEETTSENITVEGKVYCDTCRVLFETPISRRIEGATVTLLCRDRMTENVTVEIDAVTDKNGCYAIKVEGDHSKEMCQVHVTSPGKDGCNEVVAELHAVRVLLSHDDGITGPIRKADPLGFMSPLALENCAESLSSMGFLPH